MFIILHLHLITVSELSSELFMLWTNKPSHSLCFVLNVCLSCLRINKDLWSLHVCLCLCVSVSVSLCMCVHVYMLIAEGWAARPERSVLQPEHGWQLAYHLAYWEWICWVCLHCHQCCRLQHQKGPAHCVRYGINHYHSMPPNPNLTLTLTNI